MNFIKLVLEFETKIGIAEHLLDDISNRKYVEQLDMLYTKIKDNEKNIIKFLLNNDLHSIIKIYEDSIEKLYRKTTHSLAFDIDKVYNILSRMRNEITIYKNFFIFITSKNLPERIKSSSYICLSELHPSISSSLDDDSKNNLPINHPDINNIRHINLNSDIQPIEDNNIDDEQYKEILDKYQRSLSNSHEILNASIEELKISFENHQKLYRKTLFFFEIVSLLEKNIYLFD